MCEYVLACRHMYMNTTSGRFGVDKGSWYLQKKEVKETSGSWGHDLGEHKILS